MDLCRNTRSEVEPYLDSACASHRMSAIAALVALLVPCTALAQGPGYDPRAAERQFTNEQIEQRGARRASVPIARPGFAKAAADTEKELRKKPKP